VVILPFRPSLPPSPTAAIAHFRRMIETMDSVLPPSFPEKGDHLHGLAACLYEYLRPRLETLPPKSTMMIKGEMKMLFGRAWEVRRVGLGEGHPLTEESREMVEAIASAGQG